METDNDIRLQPELVAHLQEMVRQEIAPSQMLAWLKAHVEDKFHFTAYMQAACLDGDCDEGTIWLVAARWWTGNQTSFGADRLLAPIFDECRERWQRHQRQLNASRADEV